MAFKLVLKEENLEKGTGIPGSRKRPEKARRCEKQGLLGGKMSRGLVGAQGR